MRSLPGGEPAPGSDGAVKVRRGLGLRRGGQASDDLGEANEPIADDEFQAVIRRGAAVLRATAARDEEAPDEAVEVVADDEPADDQPEVVPEATAADDLAAYEARVREAQEMRRRPGWERISA